MRQTSLEAFEMMKQTGALKGQRLDVFAALVKAEPCTAGELAARMEPDDLIVWRYIVGRRLPELRDLGVVDEEEERICQVFGTRQIVWSVSGQLPNEKAAERPDNELSQLRRRTAELEDENKKLREIVDRLTLAKQVPLV